MFVVGGVYVAISLLAVSHSFVRFSLVFPGSDLPVQLIETETVTVLMSPDQHRTDQRGTAQNRLAR